ncbi:uncharacterized protein [Venturia canescens]|uniref:uncharacterized protein n=1 Tax=Venturia canescens TaxID=32260 RepID=UPI001C9CDC14|nr:uncharacterized protein LOC122415953 [Venturia canescens]
MWEIQKHPGKRSLTFRTLYYWGKFIGINPLHLSESNQLKTSYFGIFYACFLCVIYCFLYYYFFIERLNFLLPDETPVSVIADFTEIINVGLEIFFTWFINGFYQNRLKLIVESFAKAEEISKLLEIPEDYEKHFKNLLSSLIFVSLLWTALVVLNDIELTGLPTFRPLVWTSYNLLRIPTFNFVTIVLWSFVIIKRKFRRLNEKVRFLMLHDYQESRTLEKNVPSGLIKNFSYIPAIPSNRIDIISQHHRDLAKLIYTIKRHCDPLFLLCIMAHISNGLVNAYLTYRSVTDRNVMTASDCLFTFSYFIWTCYPLSMLLVMSNIFGSTLNEANRTGNVLHNMLNNYENSGDSREVAKLYMFSFNLLKNRLEISLFGLLDLNHWMVYKIVIMATTYVVIMFQFYN